jgi:hypothetical protein
VYYADLETANVPPGGDVRFTFFWTEAGHWEETDFIVRVAAENR